MPEEIIRIARCTNNIEQSDLSAVRCAGHLRFTAADAQAKCDTCGAWCGAGVADYVDGPPTAFSRSQTTPKDPS
jgi:hypothetical protein